MSTACIDQAKTLAQTHYENFPVAPFFLPRAQREAIAMIYAFARQADDVADEGCASAQQRLASLTQMRQQLETPTSDFFLALQKIQQAHRLPVVLFDDLLTAFMQDVRCTRYAHEADVLAYCRYSANPIGRLLLHLSGTTSEEHCLWSDHICTALQLINFLQDVESDYLQRQRIYIPLDDLSAQGVSDKNFLALEHRQALTICLDKQWERAAYHMAQGKALGRHLKGRFGLTVRLMIQGGTCILRQLKDSPPLTRPTLRAQDWVVMLFNALRYQ